MIALTQLADAKLYEHPAPITSDNSTTTTWEQQPSSRFSKASLQFSSREVTPHRPGLRGSFHERAIGCASGAYCRDRTATLGEVQGCRRSRGAGALVPWVRRHKWQLARGDPDALRNLTD
ncbi:hypothetical protein HFD88_002872 [Aspergillus terreus]|nr:hypothetical protein HFD88_002872 [Aspergillus terreus]